MTRWPETRKGLGGKANDFKSPLEKQLLARAAPEEHAQVNVPRSAPDARDQLHAATLGMLMRRHHRHRLATTILVVLSLLFSQLALASYVCPARTDAAAMAQMMVSGEPCEGKDQAQPLLCHQHSVGATQSFEVVKLPAASLPLVVQVLIMPLVLQAVEAVALPAAAAPEARPPPDPVFLSTLRLRV